MECSRCGHDNPDGARWCNSCGESLGAGAAKGPPRPPPSPPPWRAPPPGGFSLSRSQDLLVPAVLATIFCCIPFGVVSIVFAAQANSKWASGDRAGAQHAADQARTWLYWAVGAGVLQAGLAFMVLASAGGSGY